MTPLRFTESYRRQEYDRGKRSLFYFMKAILGFAWLEEYHAELCAFLEGRPPFRPWLAAMVAMVRGTGKSTCTSMGLPWWRAVYADSWSGKLIGNSANNIKSNFFDPMQQRFMLGRRADYLQWLYMQPYEEGSGRVARLPEGFEGWTKTEVKMIASEPGPPTLSYWGLESKFEGWHGDFCGLDDPEGGEADKSDAPNEESEAIWSKLVPLARDPERFQRLLTCTPHGQNPIAYRVLDAEGDPTDQSLPPKIDNSRRIVQVFWRGMYDELGNNNFPSRFPDRVIPSLKLNSAVWHSQYLLGRPGSSIQLFDLDRIEEFSWQWADLAKTAIRYPAVYLDEEQQVRIEEVTWPVASLRFFAHVDPQHKLDELRRYHGSKQRPSEAAISITWVAPDWNSGLWEYWTGDAGLDEQARELLRLYCRWEAYAVSYEDVGAQVWLQQYVESMERTDPRYFLPTSPGLIDGLPKALPRMSKKMIGAEDTSQRTKEDCYRTILAGYLNSGIFHLGPPGQQEKVRRQLVNALNEAHAVDLLDTIVQGPAVWKAPPPDQASYDLTARRRGFARALGSGYRFGGNPRLLTAG